MSDNLARDVPPRDLLHRLFAGPWSPAEDVLTPARTAAARRFARHDAVVAEMLARIRCGTARRAAELQPRPPPEPPPAA